MSSVFRGVVARVPGARRLRRLAFPIERARERRLQRREMTPLVESVARALDSPDATIAFVDCAPQWVDAMLKAAPGVKVVVLPDDPDEHAAMAAMEGPFDAVVAGSAPRDRRRHFNSTFFHLRPGGDYVVLFGASELEEPHGLGRLLARAESAPDQPLRTAHSRWIDGLQLLALKNHVRTRVEGRHLFLTHDLPDVRVKSREAAYNKFLTKTGGRHRVILTIPAEEPPPQARGTEGPEPRKPRMQRPITSAELSLRDYREVIVEPNQIVRDGRLLLPDTYRHNQWKELRHLRLVDVAEGFAVHRKQRSGTPKRLEGTYLHLDNEFRGHFGHLLTESVSRLWTWEEALRLDADVKVLLGATSKRPQIMSYELPVYEAAGIPADRIVLIDGPVQVERLISGSPMFSHPEFVHPRIVETWRAVGDRLAAKATLREWPTRLFIGRKTDKRACLNSDVVEGIFTEHGFEVVFPEDHSLGDQVQMFRAADVIAGYAGSGLFQAMFVPEPTHIIQVCPSSYLPRNEYLIAAALGHRIDSVVSRNPGMGVKRDFTFDVDHEGVFLRSLLEGLSARS